MPFSKMLCFPCLHGAGDGSVSVSVFFFKVHKHVQALSFRQTAKMQLKLGIFPQKRCHVNGDLDIREGESLFPYLSHVCSEEVSNFISNHQYLGIDCSVTTEQPVRCLHSCCHHVTSTAGALTEHQWAPSKCCITAMKSTAPHTQPRLLVPGASRQWFLVIQLTFHQMSDGALSFTPQLMYF